MNTGYLRITTVAPCIVPGNIKKNKNTILSEFDKYVKQTDILVFPELALTGYSCADMFLSPDFARTTIEALRDIHRYLQSKGTLVILGAPYYGPQGRLMNAAYILGVPGDILAVPKKNLPNYSEFYEKRWFSEPDQEFQEIKGDIRILQSGVFALNNVIIGIELCEDLWAVNPPSTEQVTEHGAEIIINLSASPRLVGKQSYLRDLVRMTSARLACAYVYVSAGPSESTTDLVFSGYGVASENGVILGETSLPIFTDQVMTMVYDIDLDVIRGWRRKNKTINLKPREPEWKTMLRGYYGPITRTYPKHPFLPVDDSNTYREILTTMSLGIQKRLESCGNPPAVIGVSGGSDSTLALLATVDALDCLDMSRTMIHAISMPCFGTTQRTKGNAQKLAEALGVTFKEIPINDVVTEHLKSLKHDLKKTDIAYENAQARTRTMTLFNYSNMIGGLVIGTGDLSELALGWCTYGADHLSSYNPNVSIPKTLVIPLIRWIADCYMDKNTGDQVTQLHDILLDIADTPISPELLPGQQLSEDTVGPYELMDFFLYYFLRAEWPIQKILEIAIQTFQDTYKADFIKDRMLVFLKRFQTQQFKRSCLPDGPKVGSCSLSPRGDWRMPSDMSFEVLIQEIKSYDIKECNL